jgi:hypothetical protein
MLCSSWYASCTSSYGNAELNVFIIFAHTRTKKNNNNCTCYKRLSSNGGGFLQFYLSTQVDTFICGGVWEGFKVNNLGNPFLYKGKLIILGTHLNVPHGFPNGVPRNN